MVTHAQLKCSTAALKDCVTPSILCEISWLFLWLFPNKIALVSLGERFNMLNMHSDIFEFLYNTHSPIHCNNERPLEHSPLH